MQRELKKRNSVRYKEQDYGREKIQYESEFLCSSL